jgi:hypothetical protein
LRSACMPAPPPESEPATVSTCGHGISRAAASLHGLDRGEGCVRRGEEKEERGCGRRIGCGGADDIAKWTGGLFLRESTPSYSGLGEEILPGRRRARD